MGRAKRPLASVTTADGGGLSFDYDGPLVIGATWEGPVTGSISWDYDARFNVADETVNCASGDSLACETTYFDYDEDGVLTGAGDLTLDSDPQNGLLTDTQIGVVMDGWAYDEFSRRRRTLPT